MTQRIELDFKFICLYLLNVNYNAHLQMERFVNRHLQCFLRGLNVTSFTKELISVLPNIEDLQVIEDLQKTYGRPTKILDIYIKSDAILLIGIS